MFIYVSFTFDLAIAQKGTKIRGVFKTLSKIYDLIFWKNISSR